MPFIRLLLLPWLVASTKVSTARAETLSRKQLLRWLGMGTPFKLKNGLLLISTEAPGGVYNAEQLKKIAALCASEEAVAKATEDQRLALFVVPAKAAAVAAQLKSVGLGLRHYQDGLHQPINCLGALCGEHLQDAMATSMDLADELSGTILDQPLKIGINGCARCCLATHTLDISIIGDTSGYRISLGGKNSQLPEMASFMAEGVPAAKLPKLIAKIVSIYKQKSQPGESLQEVLERAGSREFIAALAPYSQDAAQSEPFGEDAAPDAPTATDGGDLVDDDLKIDDLSGDSAFAAPGIDAAIDSEDLDSEPSFDDTDLSVSALDAGPEAIADMGAESAGETVTALADPDDFGDVSLSSNDEEPLAQPADLAEGDATLPSLEGDDELDTMSLDALADDESLAAAPAGEADLDGFALVDLPSDDVPLSDDGQGTEDNAFALATLPDDNLSIDDEFALEPDSALQPEATTASEDGEQALGELAVDEFAVDEFAVDQPALGELAVDEPAVDQPALSELAVDELALDELDLVPDLELDSAADEAPAMVPDAAPALAAVAAAPTSEVEDEMAADEIADADADAFEEKLNASIAEEGELPELEDQNSEDRMTAMAMVSGGADDLAISELDDISIEGINDENLPASLSEDVAVVSSLGLVEEGDADMAEVTDFGTDKAPPEPKAIPAKSVVKGVARAEQSDKGFEFTGLEVTADGKIALQFASGAALEIDPATFLLGGRRELKLAGKSIVLVAQNGGLNVKVDGVAIFVPHTTQNAA